MRSLIYTLWGLAGVSLVSATFTPWMIWVTALLLVFAIFFTFTQVGLYRPPEDHLGVIYEFGRFSRLVEPDEWIRIMPGISRIKAPISLHQRCVEVHLSGLLTQDQIPVDSKMLVYYKRDPRCAETHFRPQALQIPDEGWDSIIRTVLQETANEVTNSITFQELLSSRGRVRFKRALSTLLAARVRRLGLIVSPLTGVSIQMLKPDEHIWQATVDRLTAKTLGEAALARIYPILEELSQRHPEIALEALLLEYAAVMAKDGKTPQVLVAPTWRQQTQASLQEKGSAAT